MLDKVHDHAVGPADQLDQIIRDESSEIHAGKNIRWLMPYVDMIGPVTCEESTGERVQMTAIAGDLLRV